MGRALRGLGVLAHPRYVKPRVCSWASLQVDARVSLSEADIRTSLDKKGSDVSGGARDASELLGARRRNTQRHKAVVLSLRQRILLVEAGSLTAGIYSLGERPTAEEQWLLHALGRHRDSAAN